MCSSNCVVPCGFLEMGTKTCACTAGTYSQCSCPRPVSYLGAGTADYCPTSDGTTTELDETACAEEWAECIGKDPVTGVTPKGCACLFDPELATLRWVCQSTNGWFILEPANVGDSRVSG